MSATDIRKLSARRIIARLEHALSKLSPNVEGALWMLVSAIFFTAMTTLVKFLGSAYPAPLQTFYRQAASLLVILPMIVRQGSSVFKTTRPVLLLSRSAAGTFAVILANYSYQDLPLALGNALSFTRALWMAPLAVVILHERVDGVRIGASLVGFAGVMMILGLELGRPAAFWPATAGLGSAFLFAFTIMGSKIMTRDHSVLTLLAWSATLGLVFTISPALFVWRWPSFPDFCLLCLMGASAIATQACFVKSLQRGDPTATAPVDYIRLVFAIIIGMVFFHEVPTWTSLVGAAVIVSSALFLARHEHGVSARAARLAARLAAPEAEPL